MIQCVSYSLMFENRLLIDIKDINFEKGKLHIIKGENGSGKTSFLRSIVGWVKPSTGKIIIDGTWTYQPQSFHLFNPKVKDNIQHSASSQEWLNLLNLDNYGDTLVSKLSGGERQKIALVRTLSEDTDLYLIDEPTSYMDEYSKRMAYKLIQEVLLDHKKTILLIVHENVEDLFETAIQYSISNQSLVIDKIW
jgi:ABC-type multidrug transport system ATPase subunit